MAALAVFSSPLQHSVQLFKSGDIVNYNTLPNVFAGLNCLSWSFYGLILKNWYIIPVNAFGMTISLFIFMMTIGPIYSAQLGKKQLLYTILWLVFNIALLVILFSICVISISNEHTKQLIMGYSSIFYLVVFYASPLQLLFKVIQNKDASHLFFPLIVTCFVNSIAWTFYGIAIDDLFLALPNGFGILVSIVQMVLYIKYKPSHFIEVQE